VVQNIDKFEIVREFLPLNKQDLINFENFIVERWNNSEIRGPVHFSDGNEDQLIEIFKRIHEEDWVFSTWRSHYHALLKGLDPEWVVNEILRGKSITLCKIDENFYSSAIVGGTLPIALGVAMSLKLSKSRNKVWVFIGDMCFNMGVFDEIYRYSRTHDLPLNFVVEDNNLSTYTPTNEVWLQKREIPKDVLYYNYVSKYPHYGTGKFLTF
jgi:pyruvate dehydrogenase E1 component alpha subunit